jgi:hypothetical protein
MLVKRLEMEIFEDGSPYRVETLRNPDWPAIETAIKRLHPFYRPSAWLYLREEEDGDDFMAIMGGEGNYWLDVTTGPHNHRRLFNPTRGSHEVAIQTSDQTFSQYEFHTTDRIKDVLAAARFFCENADCDPTLTWE